MLTQPEQVCLGIDHYFNIGLDQITAKAEKPLSSAKIIHRISRALKEGTIKVAAFDDMAYAVVGQDEFFRSLGLLVQEFDEPQQAHLQAGILKIKRSLKQTGCHVIQLDRKIYSAQALKGP